MSEANLKKQKKPEDDKIIWNWMEKKGKSLWNFIFISKVEKKQNSIFNVKIKNTLLLKLKKLFKIRKYLFRKKTDSKTQLSIKIIFGSD